LLVLPPSRAPPFHVINPKDITLTPSTLLERADLDPEGLPDDIVVRLLQEIAELALISEWEGEQAAEDYRAYLSDSRRDQRTVDATYERRLRGDDYAKPVEPTEAESQPGDPLDIQPRDQWWLDADVVARVLPVLGIPANALGTETAGKTFPCVIPSHVGKRRADASLNPQTLMYVCWHADRDGDGKPPFWKLAEIYASQLNGRPIKLDGGAAGLWADRLLLAAGLIELSVADHQPPRGLVLKEREEKILDGLTLALRLWKRFDPDSPGTAFAVDFAATWCAVSRATAQRAIGDLRKLDIIRRVGRTMGAGLPTNIYALGDGTRRPEHWADGKYDNGGK
jgi:hypothetical protein